jgi:hypothetical protein
VPIDYNKTQQFANNFNELSNNSVTNSGVISNAVTGWDMSSLDYSAPGIEGWGNRALGLTSLVNPKAWVDTFTGVVKNNALKNPNANFLESAWQNVTDTGWGMLGGTLQGITLPLPLVKATALSIGSGLDELTDSITGKSDPDTFVDKLNKSWDLSKIDSWDTANNADRNNIGIGDIGAYIIGDIASIFLGNASKEELKAYGLQFIDSSFDIFDPAQKKDIQSHILNPAQQALNFVGDWVLDITTFIPGGAIVKGARLGFKGIAGSQLDLIRLEKASTGESTAYDTTLDFFANTNNSIEVYNGLKTLGVSTSKIKPLTKFITDAQTKQEVADVFLAAEYKNQDALVRIGQRLAPEDKKWMLVLDELNTKGNTYTRKATDPTVEKEFLEDTDFNSEFLTALDNFIDDAKISDSVKVDAEDFKTLVTEKADGYTNADGQYVPASNVMVATPLRDYGLKLSALDRASIRWKSKLISEDSWLKTVEYNSNIPGLPTVVRLIRKAPITSHRGFVDFNETTTAIDKLLSKLNDIDGLAKGEHLKSGRLQEITDKIFAARTNDDLMLVADEIEKLGISTVLKKNNIAGYKAEALIDNMLASYKMQQNAIQKLSRFGRRYHDPKDNTVYISDGVTDTADDLIITRVLNDEGIEADRYFGIDFNQLDNFARREGTRFAFLTDLAFSGRQLIGSLNRLWMASVLFRPARFPRERLAAMPGIILSGNFYDLFLSQTARQAVNNAFQNTPVRIRRAIDNFAIKKEYTGKYAPSIRKELESTDLTLETHNAFIKTLEEQKKSSSKANDEATRFDSAADRDKYFESKAKETEAKSFTDVNVNDALDANTVIPISKDRNDSSMSYYATERAKAKPMPAPIKSDATFTTSNKKIQKNTKSIDDLNKKKTQLENEIKSLSNSKPKTAEEFDANNPLSKIELDQLDIMANGKVAGRMTAARNKNTRTATLQKLTNDKDATVANAAKNNLIIRYQGTANIIPVKQAEIKQLDDELNALQKEVDELNTVVDGFKTSRFKEIEDELANTSNTLWIRTKGSDNNWRQITIDELKYKNQVGRYEYKIEEPNWKPSVSKRVKYSGKDLDLDSEDTMRLLDEVAEKTNFKDGNAVKEHLTSGRATINECGRGANLLNALTAAGVGVMHWADEAGKTQQLVNPQMIHTADYNPNEIVKEALKKDYESVTVGQRAVSESIDLRTKKEVNAEDVEAYEMLKKIQSNEYISNPDGYMAFLDRYEEKIERAYAVREQLQQKRNALADILEQERKGLKPKISEGLRQYKGQTYSNFGEGQTGRYAEAIISPTETWKEVHDMNRVANAVYDNTNGARVADLEPGDKDYYDGLASWLQLYGRGDDVFMMLASGKTEAEVIDWLKNTSAGKDYARSKQIGSQYEKASTVAKAETVDDLGYNQSFEEYITDRKKFVDEQLFDSQLKDLFFSEEKLTGSRIAEIFKGRENQLLPIAGRIFNPTEMRRATQVVGDFLNKANKFIVENPQQILENVPMATAHYNERMKTLIDMNLEKFGRDLTIDEINVLEKQARKDATRHVRKWMYNVQSKSNFVDAISMVVPFVTAYTFTIKQLLRGLQDNPAAALWLASGINKVNQSAQYIDAEGNETDLFNAQNMVLPLDENIAKVLKGTIFGKWLGDGKEIRLSMKSLNVWFGGEVIPGPGPLITLPVSELVKGNTVEAIYINELSKKYIPLIPGGEGLIDYLLPMGPSGKPLSFDQLLPTWVNVVADAGLFTKIFDPEYRGQAYVDAYSKVMAHESAKARLLGPNEPLPTSEEIQAKVDALYGLKFLSAFFGPVAYSVKTEADLARETYRQYQKTYGENADWQFLTDHPELIGGMVGATKNNYGLTPDKITIQNLENNPELVNTFLNAGEGGKDMLGFFMNGSNNSEFDDYAYTYLQNKTPGIGEETLYSKLSPAEVGRKAAAKAGWVYFNQFQAAVDADAIERDVDPATDIKIKEYKKAFITEMKAKYPEWASEYGKADVYKFNDRADTVELLLQNDNFVNSNHNPDFVNALALFVDQRNELQSLLQARKQAGGSGSITSESNTDIASAYNKVIYQLKTESIRFSDFYNRFFDGDSLTV